MAVLRGAKTFTLYDPTQSARLYAGTPLVEARFEAEVVPGPGPPGLGGGVSDVRVTRSKAQDLSSQKPVRLSPYSPVNISSPSSVSRFPEFAEAIPTQCRAEAGDLLYVPSRWWHEVTSEGDDEDDKTVAVNFWFHPWYHHLGFEESNPVLIRNEHYSHLSGDRRSAFPCSDDERFVCWVNNATSSSANSATSSVALDATFLRDALKFL